MSEQSEKLYNLVKNLHDTKMSFTYKEYEIEENEMTCICRL